MNVTRSTNNKTVLNRKAMFRRVCESMPIERLSMALLFGGRSLCTPATKGAA